MALTGSQYTALRNAIDADGALAAQPMTNVGFAAIASAMNALASPDFWVWRTSVTKAEFVQSTSQDATNFIWAGNGFITRSAGELTAWAELFNHIQSVNPSLDNVRQAFADIFSGSGNAASNRAHMLAVARRKATRAEKLFATGTGSTASPAKVGFEGSITIDDVEIARQL